MNEELMTEQNRFECVWDVLCGTKEEALNMKVRSSLMMVLADTFKSEDGPVRSR
uniref:hypothetical protein n=1 Tax=Halomonas sp. TaxID=1486246 RepID=UPI002616BB9F|nr:hypothetical protein [Halomonas sp.]